MCSPHSKSQILDTKPPIPFRVAKHGSPKPFQTGKCHYAYYEAYRLCTTQYRVHIGIILGLYWGYILGLGKNGNYHIMIGSKPLTLNPQPTYPSSLDVAASARSSSIFRMTSFQFNGQGGFSKHNEDNRYTP